MKSRFEDLEREQDEVTAGIPDASVKIIALVHGVEHHVDCWGMAEWDIAGNRSCDKCGAALGDADILTDLSQLPENEQGPIQEGIRLHEEWLDVFTSGEDDNDDPDEPNPRAERRTRVRWVARRDGLAVKTL